MNLTCLKSGIWQAELRVPQEVRPVIGKTRFAKSTGTRDKREAVLRAAPMLKQWQSDIELAKSDPQTLIAKQAQRKAQQAFRPLSQESGVAEDHLAWLRDLPPSKASKYEAIEWGSGIPLPAYMESFIQSHYTKPNTQSEARRYVLEATTFMPTLESLTRFFPLYYRKKVSVYQYGTSRASGGVFGRYRWLRKRLVPIYFNCRLRSRINGVRTQPPPRTNNWRWFQKLSTRLRARVRCRALVYEPEWWNW